MSSILTNPVIHLDMQLIDFVCERIFTDGDPQFFPTPASVFRFVNESRFNGSDNKDYIVTVIAVYRAYGRYKPEFGIEILEKTSCILDRYEIDPDACDANWGEEHVTLIDEVAHQVREMIGARTSRIRAPEFQEAGYLSLAAEQGKWGDACFEAILHEQNDNAESYNHNNQNPIFLAIEEMFLNDLGGID